MKKSKTLKQANIILNEDRHKVNLKRIGFFNGLRAVSVLSNLYHSISEKNRKSNLPFSLREFRDGDANPCLLDLSVCYGVAKNIKGAL